MNRYEILMLATPVITKDEASTIEKGLEAIIKQSKGEVISFERWGKCRLAYPVKKNDYGIYFLTRFEAHSDSSVFKDLKTAFSVKYNDAIMRHIVVKLDAKQSLEYKRPQTVEDVPTRDVDSFLRENKMEGLLSSVPGDKKEAVPKKQEAADVAPLESLEATESTSEPVKDEE